MVDLKSTVEREFRARITREVANSVKMNSRFDEMDDVVVIQDWFGADDTKEIILVVNDAPVKLTLTVLHPGDAEWPHISKVVG